MSNCEDGLSINPLEMPPEDTRPSYPWTPASEKRARNETAKDMLRRANEMKTYEPPREEPLTDAERGMSAEEFASLRPELQLQIYNMAMFRRKLTNV